MSNLRDIKSIPVILVEKQEASARGRRAQKRFDVCSTRENTEFMV